MVKCHQLGLREFVLNQVVGRPALRLKRFIQLYHQHGVGVPTDSQKSTLRRVALRIGVGTAIGLEMLGGFLMDITLI